MIHTDTKLKCLLALVFFATVPTAWAATVTLNFDEFGTASPIDASTVSGLGVTFLFSGGTAIYNDSLGGGTVLVTDPALTGLTSGALTLTFDYSTPIVEFDIAMLSGYPILNAYTVTIGDTLFEGDTAPQIGGVISEGHFSYSGPTPVSNAVITFDSVDATEFALDNLTFGTPDQTPEPGMAFFLGPLLIMFGIRAKRNLWAR